MSLEKKQYLVYIISLPSIEGTIYEKIRYIIYKGEDYNETSLYNTVSKFHTIMTMEQYIRNKKIEELL